MSLGNGDATSGCRRQKKLYDHICINFCGRYDHEASDAQKLMVVKKTQYSS